MFRLDGGEHGIDPTRFTVALIFDWRHTVEHLIGEMLGFLLCTAYTEQKDK